LYRHGESKGQAAKSNGLDRKRCPLLRDAGLTRKGVSQAKAIPSLISDDVMQSIELVVSSPLTRALHTALLAFQTSVPTIVHYDIRECGSGIPENLPRATPDVKADLEGLCEGMNLENVDFESLRPFEWPEVDVSNSRYTLEGCGVFLTNVTLSPHRDHLSCQKLSAFSFF